MVSGTADPVGAVPSVDGAGLIGGAPVGRFLTDVNPQTGELVPTEYFSAAEVGRMLHTSPTEVRRACAAGEWPHRRVGVRQTPYLSAAHVAQVVRLLTVDPTEPVWIDPDEDGGLS